MHSKATVYLDPKIHRAVKIKAAHTDRNISELVNEALRLSLREDALDLEAVKKRAREPVKSLETVIKNLKREGRI